MQHLNVVFVVKELSQVSVHEVISFTFDWLSLHRRRFCRVLLDSCAVPVDSLKANPNLLRHCQEVFGFNTTEACVHPFLRTPQCSRSRGGSLSGNFFNPT